MDEKNSLDRIVHTITRMWCQLAEQVEHLENRNVTFDVMIFVLYCWHYFGDLSWAEVMQYFVECWVWIRILIVSYRVLKLIFGKGGSKYARKTRGL